jgi:integrase/recombinase XerD
MMNDWYQRMVDTLQLNGKGERTQQAYTRSVRMLSQFYDKTPDLVSEQELQDYRKNVNHWSPKTMRICIAGYAFSTRKSSSTTGTSSASLEPKLNDAFPPS